MKTITANSYFSGCGLMDVGLERGGITVQTSYEIDADAVAVAKANFKHDVVQCDLTKKLVKDEKPCDVRVFTYPCTKYSPMRKFPLVMEVMTKLPGYYVNVFCPVSTQTWLPQKRDRLIIIGSRKNFMWREPQSARRLSLKDIIEDDPQVEIPDYVYSRLAGKYRDQPAGDVLRDIDLRWLDGHVTQGVKI